MGLMSGLQIEPALIELEAAMRSQQAHVPPFFGISHILSRSLPSATTTYTEFAG